MQSPEGVFFPRMHEQWGGISPQELLGFIRPKLQDAWTLQELVSRLGRGTRVKFHLELSIPVPLLADLGPFALLDLLVRAGQHIDVVIGDYTAPLLNLPIADVRGYMNHVGRFFDLSRIQFHQNSRWLSQMSITDFFGILGRLPLSSVQPEGQSLTVAQAYYEVWRGLDSVQLGTDIEIGLASSARVLGQGRAVAQSMGRPPTIVLLLPMLDSNVAITAADAPLDDKFGKVMSIPDAALLDHFRVFLPVHEQELAGLQAFIAAQPLEAKKQLATLLIARETKNLDQARAVRGDFERKFSKRTFTESDFQDVTVPRGSNIVDALVATGLFRGRSEVRRLLTDNAVRLAHEPTRILTQDVVVHDVMAIKIGKRRFVRLNPAT